MKLIAYHGDTAVKEKYLTRVIVGCTPDAFQAIKEDSNKRFSAFREVVTRHAPKVVLPEEELPIIQTELPPDFGDSVPF